MAKLGINTGSSPNDGTGDSLLQAAIKLNSNFNEIYSAIGNGTTITNSIGFARTAGISTLSGYASTAGIATFAVTAGISSYSVISGLSSLSSYATNAGIATVALFAGNFSSIPDITVGVVTATSYNGSGVNLTGVVTSILAGSNVSVARTGGTVTINSTAQNAVSSQWATVATGIVTSSRVGIGTTLPISELHLNNGTLSITGSSGGIQLNDNRRITLGSGGNSSIYYDSVDLRINTSSSVRISDGNNNIFVAVSGEGASLYYNGSRKLQTLSDGLDVTGKINLSGNINASGIVTASNFVGDGSGLTNVSSQLVRTAAGIHTLSNVGIGTTNPTSALTVKGNTSIETLNVSGVSTFPINVAVGVDFSHQGSIGKFRISGDGVYGNGRIGFYDNLNNLKASWDSNLSTGSIDIYNYINSGTQNITISAGSSVVLQHGGTNTKLQTLGTGVTVTGTTFTNQLSVSGVSTLNSNVSVGGTINLDGGLKLTTNNPTIVGTSGTVGEIKRIGGAPFFYDGSTWREFVLSSGTPVSVPADTEWDNVVFRTTFDTDFTDSKFGATPVYVSAGSSIVGAAVTIGTGAFRNDGAVGSGVSYAYRSDYDFTGSWTIEFWMYVDSGPVYFSPTTPSSLISMNSTTGIGTSGNWSLAQYRDQFGNVYITWYNANHPTYKSGYQIYGQSGSGWNSVIIDKWNHFALVREGDNGSLHFYVNGIEQSNTVGDTVIDNDILNISGNGLHFGGDTTFTIGSLTFNSNETADVIFDDVRISCGVGTAGQRYNSIGISTYATFTPPTTALPTTGTLSSYVQPPGDKYGEIGLGTSPTWRGTSGVTVTQQSSGNYRVSFASSYTNANDYFVLTQGMDQGFASYVGVARSTTHIDFAINKQSDDSAVDAGSLSVQIKNHV